MIETAYVRFADNNLPENYNLYASTLGFTKLGIEVVPFYTTEEIVGLKFDETTVLHGFLNDTWKALEQYGIEKPTLPDYPEALSSFYHRKISESTLGEVMEKGEPVFIKPLDHKLFTGFVWSPATAIKAAHISKQEPVFTSEVLDFVSEYRCFILDGEILGVKHYYGDWSVAPDSKVVNACVLSMRYDRGYRTAYSIDFGITADGVTAVVECNDATSLGSYGLHPVYYARMIVARWLEIILKPRY